MSSHATSYTIKSALITLLFTTVTGAARAASYVLVAETDEGCRLYLDGTDFVQEGCNVHVRNGDGSTASTNGLGNLIVGYDEDSGDTKSGSHNLVVGPYHSYSNYGGLVAGYNNVVSGSYASVSGGYGNEASGGYASVSGGRFNEASNSFASVSGGYGNKASYYYASVSGGYYNEASGHGSSVSGGYYNKASGTYDYAP